MDLRALGAMVRSIQERERERIEHITTQNRNAKI